MNANIIIFLVISSFLPAICKLSSEDSMRFKVITNLGQLKLIMKHFCSVLLSLISAIAIFLSWKNIPIT